MRDEWSGAGAEGAEAPRAPPTPPPSGACSSSASSSAVVSSARASGAGVGASELSLWLPREGPEAVAAAARCAAAAREMLVRAEDADVREAVAAQCRIFAARLAGAGRTSPDAAAARAELERVASLLAPELEEEEEEEPGTAESELFEHERFFPVVGWREPGAVVALSATHFHRRFGDRDGAGGRDALPEGPCAEPGWRWVGPWRLDRSGFVDSEGWAYALAWPAHAWPPPKGAEAPGPLRPTRRRRWVRTRVRTAPLVGSSRAGNVASNARGGQHVWQPEDLGRGADAGGSGAAEWRWRSREVVPAPPPALLRPFAVLSGGAGAGGLYDAI